MRFTVLAAMTALGWATQPAIASPTAPLLTLEEAVARSVQGSPLLDAREASIAASGAGVDQARARPNPELEVEFENFTGSGRYSDFGSTETTISYRQTLERGTKRRARTALAEADQGIARLERTRSTAEVAFETQKAWSAVLEAEASLRDAKERLRLAEDLAGIVRHRVEAARDPLAAGLKADNKVAAALVGVDQNRLRLEAARAALAARWEGDAAEVAVDATAFFRMQEGPAGSGAPDLVVSEARIERAAKAYELEKARAKQDPTIGVGMRRFEDGGEVAGLVSFSIPLAFFDKNRGNINKAMAERQEAQFLLAEDRRRHAAALRAARAEQDAARAEALAIRDDMIPRAAEAARGARDGYDRGAFAYLDVADAQHELADLRTREIAALKKFHAAQAVIDRLTGRWISSDAAQEF
ncbi:TolC family protein [Emcibacter sp. SYSU 3D8]|uniref:TolC family protein n=1 Tax=Emcibacter sp. SYSU 3D8 TaxID=3133969 RepID=UPI0031FE5645